MKYYCEDAESVLSEVGSSQKGLSSEEAAKRLERDGRNELAAAKKPSLISQFFKQMADPMIIILLVAAAISAVTSVYQGEGAADVIIILFVVIVNAVLGVYQENKAEKAIEALQAMSAATSRVLRGGKVTVVPSAELVVGDVVLLEAGDAVPADGRLLESASLKIEEAALTGESVPVTKFIDILDPGSAPDVPLGDRKNMMYMGSTVVYGRGTAVVTATGMDTEMGRIADALSKAELYFDDTSNITVPEMKARVRRLKDVDLVVIDYLQLMTGTKRTDNRAQEVAEITRSLELMAKDLKLPVVTCSQLNRQSASGKGKDHKPTMSELRESGSIEQDADIILLLYRESYFDEDKGESVVADENKAQVIIAKNRHGGTTDVDLNWNGQYTLFTTAEYNRNEP